MSTTILVGLVLVLFVMLIAMFFKMNALHETITKQSPNQITPDVFNNSITTLITKLDNFYSEIGKLKEDYGRISNNLLTLNEISNDTKTLKSYLTNPKVRGAWGERLVEDIITLVGLQEGINYVKQKGSGEGRPDFTFFLPNGKKVNLDAKFSLDNYINFIKAEEKEKEKYKKLFLENIKETINNVAKRNYIDESTVDFVLMFIASEAVYSFIISEDKNIIDYALKKGIILCSPITLYAVLSIIRQITQYYTLEKASREAIACILKFKDEWETFEKSLEDISKRIDNLRNAFAEVMAIKKNDLDRVIEDIDIISKAISKKENIIQNGNEGK